jgi:predicted cation transporter
MKQKPLADSEKAAYRQLVKDKSLPLRIRYFSERLLKIFLYLGILTLTVYGLLFVWLLVYAKEKADRIEQKIQDKIIETQRESE